ncbi:hypothetical protein [Parasphingorhabdus sp.]|uniref:hypothetical protein n=1 Tax=Parasphingorhabdus sp. TaxID=2709688 RepID=UPI00326744CB
MSRALPLLAGLALSIGAVASGFLIGANHLEGAQLAARWTSRVGLPVFLIAYLASSLHKIWPGDLTRTFIRRRRQWGLAFAWTHSVHLVALIYFLTIAGMPPEAVTILGGGLAYVMIYLMALTSNNWSMKKLGANWSRLHKFGIHYIWLIYLLTYAGRLEDPSLQHIGIIGVGLLILALILRIVARWRKKLP